MRQRIAVVGGGPGGLAFARVLHRHRHPVAVFERDPAPDARTPGGTLDLHEGWANSSTSVLARLRDDEADALGHARLDRGRAFSWTWRDDQTLVRPLRPVVHAAVQLLTAGALDRIKGCGGCRFLFVDESKNRSRRWCSMDDCGTSEKIRRYVAARRTRATG
jgi:2-polyprenyl-6-methoxyphenol hydroxylase-like FAD-dependent oxidoreductase